MSLEAKGLYIEILMELWLEGKLPSDPKILAKIFGLNLRTFGRVFAEIQGKFYVTSEFLSHSRVTEERNKMIVKSEQNAINGRKGGLSKATARANTTNSPTPDPSNTDTDSDTDKSIKGKTKTLKFKAPTANEILGYFLGKNSIEYEANKFFNFYESNGWKVGKNKMKNWKASASGWISRNKPNKVSHDPRDQTPKVNSRGETAREQESRWKKEAGK